MVRKVRDWEKEFKGKNIDPLDCPNKIRVLRFDRGWSAGELGKRIGTTNAIVLGYERGRFNPGWNMINRLCEEFGVEAGNLFWRKGEKEAILKEREEKNE